MSRLNEIRLYKNITDEQFQTLINLKLIMIVAPKRQGDEETVLATNLGRIYADYWKIDLISGLPDLKKNFEDWAGKLGQLMMNPIISSMVPVILSVAKMATSPIGTSESTVESSE